MNDHKKYALSQVENFLYDAMSSNATPQEIYDVIKGVVEDNYNTYKVQAKKAYQLLELLNCHRPIDFKPVVELKDKVKKWVLPVEEVKDGDTDEIEYCITFPDDLLEAADLKEGDQIEWIDQGDGSYMLQKVKQSQRES